MEKSQKQVVNLIRIMGTDINAESSIMFGIAKIKGVSIMLANAICIVLKFKKMDKISSLSEKDIEKLENYLSDNQFKGIPSWLLNQRKEASTGNDLHFITKDIDYDLLQLKRRLSKLKTYKGLRYRANLPVRGQRTKSNFRRNKTIAAMKAKSTGGKK